MTATDNAPLLATAVRDDDDPIEWVLHDTTARQAVMVGAFLRWSYGREAVNVSYISRQTFADFVAFQGREYEEFLADGWPRPFVEE